MNGLETLAPFAALGRDAAFAAAAVFMRAGAAVALLPGFGENPLPARVKLGAAVMLAVIVWPAVTPPADLGTLPPARLGLAFLAEAAAGLALGLSARLTIFALQMAGSIAAQSVSVAQMFGEGLTADPQPAYANLLAVAGVALAFALGLPAYAAAALIGSYETFPFGAFAAADEVSRWGVTRIAAAFASAVGIASPFVVGALAYNVALGAINKAMPQLMVAFVGAPAITAGALALMALATPVALRVWARGFEAVMADPFGAIP
jgi:flagellar biosynthetic protein FliR